MDLPNTNKLFAFPAREAVSADAGPPALSAGYDYSGLPDAVAAEVKAATARIRGWCADVEDRAVLIGRELIRVKKLLRRHGAWLPWLKAETTWGERNAQYKMRAARGIGRTIPSPKPGNRGHVSGSSFAWDVENLDDGSRVLFSRSFAMPSADTFSIPPIAAFVRRHLAASHTSIDPFARNCTWATYTNDLASGTLARYHMDAEGFCLQMQREGVVADLGLFDPPYSARQITEMYHGIGREVGQDDTQCSALHRRVRDSLDPLIRPGGVVLSFGWNSVGMGIKRGYTLEEVHLVVHGGGHNDTICIAERKVQGAWDDPAES